MAICEVMADDAPERGESGAITKISPIERRAWMSSLIPFASTPSSFDMRIRGFSCICVILYDD